MKRAVILHGTDSGPDKGWFPWLRAELEERGYEVWVPQLPDAREPNARKYTDFLLSGDWSFQDNLIVGHSSGAVEVLHLLQNLPEGVQVGTAVLVGSFKRKLIEAPQWTRLKGMFDEQLDMSLIQSKAEKFLFVHGDDDPWCDPAQATELAQELKSEIVLVPGGQHFSYNLDPAYAQFPALIKILEDRQLL